MTHAIQIQLEMPDDLARFHLPTGVQHRLQELLDRQDAGHPLTADERSEAEGLVNVAEMLTLLRLRAQRKRLFTTHELRNGTTILSGREHGSSERRLPVARPSPH